MTGPVGKAEAIRAFLSTPEVQQTLRDGGSHAASKVIASAAVALADPDSVMARFKEPMQATFAGRALAARNLEDPEMTLFIDRLAASLAIAMTAVPSIDSDVKPAKQGGVFGTMSRACALEGEGRRRSVLADTGALATALYEGLVDTAQLLPAIEDARTVRAGLSHDASEKLSTRMKDLNALLFAPACSELARLTRALRPDTPVSDGAVAIREARGMPELVKDSLSSLPLSGLTRVPRRLQLCDRWNSVLPGAVVTALPVGNWPDGGGERLATALLRATQLMMDASKQLGPMFDSPVHRAAMGAITFQRNGAILMGEGVATTAQSIALLLAQPPADMSLDQALQALQESQLVSTLALGAPIGVVQPLAVGGWVPSEPFTVGDNGRLLMPQSLKDLLRRAHANRVLPSREINGYAAGSGLWDLSANMGETKRGCPVAGRVCRADGKGGVELGDKTPLSEISEAMIGLTRQILEGPPIPIEPYLDLSSFR